MYKVKEGLKASKRRNWEKKNWHRETKGGPRACKRKN
jgi:hypothetical protein